MGDEAACFMYYDDPELMHDITQTLSDCTYRVAERISSEMLIDHISVHEDMAGKSGSLFGPAQVDRFIKPYYRAVWDVLKGAGASLFSQDSDGDMNPIIGNMIDCGVNFMYPCEPGSGMDIVEIRGKYGKRVCLKGGIDKYVLRKNKDDIRRELEYKLCGATMGGGTIFALDHRIPNGTPVANYRYYAALGRKLLNL